MGFGGMDEVRTGKTNGATSEFAVTYARMTTPQDHARRLGLVLEALVSLVSLLEAQRGFRIENGRVQVDVAVFGQILKERFRERSFRHGREGLAELFRCSLAWAVQGAPKSGGSRPCMGPQSFWNLPEGPPNAMPLPCAHANTVSGLARGVTITKSIPVQFIRGNEPQARPCPKEGNSVR